MKLCAKQLSFFWEAALRSNSGIVDAQGLNYKLCSFSWFKLDTGCNISVCVTDPSCLFCTLKLSWVCISLLFPNMSSLGLKWQEYWEIDSSALHVNIRLNSMILAVPFWATLTHPVSCFSNSVFYSDSWRPTNLFWFSYSPLAHLFLSHNILTSLTVPAPLCLTLGSLGRYCFPVKWTLAKAECFLQ